MKCVILAGGLGSRISEESHLRPKPMIEIGGKPIIWHIMKIYSAHGINDFVVCLGYKGYVIKEYFANYFLHMSDVTIDMAHNRMEVHQKGAEPWRVTLVDTGENTQTGGRLKRVAPYVAGEEFCFTYGDGVADIDIGGLIAFHRAQKVKATLTVVQPPGRFGAVVLEDNLVTSFQEKPRGDGGWINGGFFVLSPEVIDYIQGDATVWEREPLETLARNHALAAYFHRGFWQPMDTLRDKNHLDDLWDERLAAVEGVVNRRDFWSGKRVLITGYTGFKGGWLALWLQRLGAQVMGYSLPAPTQPSFYETARVAESVQGVIADIRELPRLVSVFGDFSPEVVFHLAAQPLVRASYAEPVETYSVNMLGTVHVLEAVRRAKSVVSAVMVTTDKCYENLESDRGYRETDRLGGHDPYSNSKACAELAVDSYRRSYFGDAAAIASARAGNVIGGGDWAADRLVPDLVRAALAGRPLVLRSPQSVRPWQHVLEPLSGYLMLAQRLCDDRARYAQAWNFGPLERDARTVEDIVRLAAHGWGGALQWTVDAAPQPRETKMLKLDSSKAAGAGWRPLLSAEQAVEWTMEWYRAWHDGRDVKALTLDQIERYSGLAAEGKAA